MLGAKPRQLMILPNSGLYLAASTVGPAAGFIIGGLSLNIWGDIGKTDYRE